MPKIKQEITFTAPVSKVYEALTQSAAHAAFTGAPAEISGDEGGAFSAYGGKVHGRQIELVPNERVVQAWRAGSWPEGVFSIARYDLSDVGGKTKLVFEQDGVPEDQVGHIDGGWHKMYWEPLRKHLER
jgi:activator of HSP90 ATPase